MTDKPIRTCTACGEPLPASKADTMSVKRQDGFCGVYCAKEACRDAGYAAAYEDGRDEAR